VSDVSSVNTIINGGTLVVVVGGIIGIFTWLTSDRRSVREALEKKDEEVSRDLRQIEAEVDNVRHDISALDRASVEDRSNIRKEVGETGHALRTKMHELEVYVRDEYVHIKTFDLVIGELKSSVDKGVERLEKYFDKAIERVEKRINGNGKN
jgi:hypothetical protein